MYEYHKILTSHNGRLLQITFTPWEITVLQSMVELANIPSVTDRMNVKHPVDYNVCYASNQSVGMVMRDFYKGLDILRKNNVNPKNYTV